jgi:HSP20 family protein
MYPIAQLINAALENSPSSCSPRYAAAHTPRTNILEGEQDYRIVMDLAGVRNEDLDISLEDDSLTIKAERSLEVPEGYTSRRSEMLGKASFQRSFNLGHQVDAEKISAQLDHGVLTVTLPKSARAVARRIEVK